MKRAIPFFLVLLSPGFLWGGSFNNKGASTAKFLQFGAGARAVSMGEAFSAVVDDATALYWNPAGLLRVQNHSATFMHATHIDSSFLDYGAYAHKLSEKTAVGVGMQYFSAGDISETDSFGFGVGSFKPTDMAISVGVARQVKSFSAGLTAKLVRSKIVDSAQTLAFDVGILSPSYFKEKVQFAFTATQMGGSLKFDSKSESLPLELKVGGAAKIKPAWTASLDLGLPKDNSPYLALGNEYAYGLTEGWDLKGRIGYNTRSAQDVAGLTAVSFGLGLGVNLLNVDYGLVPIGDLGLTHRVALTYDF